MYPAVFDLFANPSFVQSSASAQLTLIPLCTLFPLNISRFHAHTRRHNRCVIVYPFAARHQGWDSSHRGALPCGSGRSLTAFRQTWWKIKAALRLIVLIWITGLRCSRHSVLTKGVSDSCRQTHVPTLQTLPRGWAWCACGWLVHVCVSEAYYGMSKNFFLHFCLSVSQMLWINTPTEDQTVQTKEEREDLWTLGKKTWS